MAYPLKIVVVDDEPWVLEHIETLLKEIKNHDVELIGSARRLKDAEALIYNKRPNLVFFDINLMGESGFDLLTRFERKGDLPFCAISMTGYPELFQQTGLDNRITDYIAKPPSYERLDTALTRAERFLRTNQWNLIPYDTRDEIILYNPRDILYLTTHQRRYTKIVYSNGSCKIVHRYLSELESNLDKEKFFRSHRSCIVSTQHIFEPTKTGEKTFELIMSNGARAPIAPDRLEIFKMRNAFNND